MKPIGVGTVATRAMLAAFEELRLDAAALRRGAGLTDAELGDPDGLVPPDRFYRMWELAERAWGRPLLGLRAGLVVPLGAYEVLDYLIQSSSTLEQCMHQLVEYFAVATTTATYEISVGSEGAFCEMVWRIPPAGTMFHLRDFSLALMTVRVAAACGRRPARVEVSAPLFGTEQEYQRALETPVLRSDRGGLLYSLEAWRAPHLRADDALNRTLRRHAQLLLQRRPEAGDESIRAALHAELLRSSRVGLVSIEVSAKRLGVSPRTLQRRLRDEGTTFAQVCDEVRASLARSYLGDRGLTVSEVAYLLGFSESSAFSRAFRRWTGTTPQAFRADG